MNLGNKARYIPSGALTGADVQGLGGENRKGQAEDRSVGAWGFYQVYSKIEKSAPLPSREPIPKARKIPERGIVAALMPGVPVHDFDG